jgi:hypothetical protein
VTALIIAGAIFLVLVGILLFMYRDGYKEGYSDGYWACWQKTKSLRGGAAE